MGTRERQTERLEGHPVRWIVDDVNKFLAREIKRGRCYDAILLDPPSFGREKAASLQDRARSRNLATRKVTAISPTSFT